MENGNFQIQDLLSGGLWEYRIQSGTLVSGLGGNGKPGPRSKEIPGFLNVFYKLAPESEAAAMRALCISIKTGEEAFRHELRLPVDGGTLHWLRFEGYAVYDAAGKPEKVIGRTLDVEKEKHAETVVVEEAHTDAITGVHTEAAMHEQFEKLLQGGAEGDRHAFIVMNVEQFAYITDTWGHAYGDYVLERLASGLVGLFTPEDSIGRIMDDEFVILKRNVKNPAEIFAQARSIAKMAEHIELKRDGRLAIKVGVSIFPTDGKDWSSLYYKSKLALQKSMSSAEEICTLYDPSLSEHPDYVPKKDKPEESQTETKKILTAQYGPVEKFIINKTFDLLAGNDSSSEELMHIFEEVGKYYHYNRIYTIQYDHNRRHLQIPCFWEPTENPYVAQFETLMQDNWKAISERFANDRLFTSPNTAQLGLPMSDEMKAHFQDASLLQFVTMNTKEQFTCVSFEKEAGQNWPKEEQEVLVNISKLLGIYMERVRTKQVLQDEISYTHAIIENQQITSYTINPETYELIYVGDYTGRQYPDAHAGMHCYQAIVGRKKPCANCPVAFLNKDHPIHATEAYYEKQQKFIRTTASYIKDATNSNSQCLLCWSDVSEFVDRIRSKDLLTDALTTERFEQEVEDLRKKQPGKPRCLCYFNFPQFGDLNDVWGYQVCNEILKNFIASIRTNLHEDEPCARVNGAKFVFLINYDDKERTEARINMLLQMAHNEVLRLYPDLQLNVWCGMCRFDDESFTEVMDRANLARKSIGSQGDAPTIALAFYTDELRQINSFREFVEKAMHDALEQKEFKVFFQPKREKEGGKMIGAEALVRWITAEGQVLEPSSFQSIFEENGFITELDYYVHKETFRLLREWLDKGVTPPVISLKSSWQYLFSVDFLSRTKYLLQHYRITPERIELIIPEGMGQTNFQTVLNLLQELQGLGFNVDVDDYLAKCAMKEYPKNLPASVVQKNPAILRLLQAMEQKRLNAPMPPEDFQALLNG